jgi:hypothetical protein
LSPPRLPPSLVAFAAFALALLVAASAHAHKPSDSYLTLTVAGDHVEGRWDIALRDLDDAMTLDRDGDGVITWGELRSRGADAAGLALARLALDADGVRCETRPRDLRTVRHSDGGYAVLGFDATCQAEPRALEVDYSLFFDLDPQHHGVVRIDDGTGTRTAIFTSAEQRQVFERSTLATGRQIHSAIRLGVAHIFAGIDHLLFLVALLLPSVLARRAGTGAWEPLPRLRPALVGVLAIVSSFTLAHSITLSLAALDVLRLPSRFVESGIAASVVVAALNNVWPLLERDRWTAAFALGLLHGFGFSASLMDLGLPRQNLLVTLFGFNVGVEVGQMCVVAAFVPLAYVARGTWAYRQAGLVGGSLAIAGIASVWLVERAFAIRVF